MAETVYSVTFKQDYQGYSAGETAAFVKTTATKLFALGIGDLSSGDQTSLAADIIAAKAANPLPSLTVTSVVNPDGTISVRLPSDALKYGV